MFMPKLYMKLYKGKCAEVGDNSSCLEAEMGSPGAPGSPVYGSGSMRLTLILVDARKLDHHDIILPLAQRTRKMDVKCYSKTEMK